MPDEERGLVQKLYEGLSPNEFEIFLKRLLNAMGFQECEVTGGSGDRGVDLEAIWENRVPGLSTDMEFIIQAKRFDPDNTISPSYVRELRGALTAGEMGLLITTANATENTIEEGLTDALRQVSVIDGEKLIDLCKKYEVGTKKTYEIDLSSITEREEAEEEEIEEAESEELEEVSKEDLLSGCLSSSFDRIGNTSIYEGENRKVIYRYSKKYSSQRSRDYWFSITPKDLERVDEHNIEHFVFGCDKRGVVLITTDCLLEEIENDNLNDTTDETGEVMRYHIQFDESESNEIIWVKKGGVVDPIPEFYPYDEES